MKENKIFMGIDVSKETLDLSLNQKHYKITNTDIDIKRFIQKHETCLVNVALCALEATGGYELKVMRILQRHGVPVHRANPLHVKNFIRASNQKAKTDAIDAYLLAQYAIFVADKEKGDPFMTDRQHTLQQLRTIERSLEDGIHGYKCRLDHVKGVALNSVKQHLNVSEKHLQDVREEMNRIIQDDAKLSKKQKVMMEVKGIGQKIANTLICDVPELGTMTKKQAASLLGVAPFTRQSGKTSFKSHIRGGRFHARKALYMGALVCMRHCPKLSTFYHKLKDAGKTSKMALVALMRKLIVELNARIRVAEQA